MAASPAKTPPSAWWTVMGFGVVSLFADMVYEGARSLYGPALLALGASATIVGLITGLGEAMALIFRLVTGPVADRRGAHWSFTIVGYALTALGVPLLAFSPSLGALSLTFAALLILLERTGKAVRSPSKTALLAHAARAVGRGRGFGVHKALDQIGSFAGPLMVAAVVASAGGTLWHGFSWLALPGVLAMLILFFLRYKIPDPTIYDIPSPDEARPHTTVVNTPVQTPEDHPTNAAPKHLKASIVSWWRETVGADLPKVFFFYASAVTLTTGGLVTFAVISVHLTRDLHIATGWIPTIYAVAMLIEALVALLTGRLYDTLGPKVLYIVPVFVALVPVLSFRPSVGVAMAGVAVWAAATAIQDSTIKALVAELVPSHRLATAYGLFAAFQGTLAIVGGVLAGYLLDHSIPALIAIVAVSQCVALALLWVTQHHHNSAPQPIKAEERS